MENRPNPNIEIPDVCRQQCEERFTQNPGEIDIYDSTVDGVAQENCGGSHGNDLEYFGEGLQVREGSKRVFSVSEGCRNCGSDYMETVYVFDCPHHES